MTTPKFTPLERIKNHIRSYHAAINEGELPTFEPLLVDVEELIKKYEMLAKTIQDMVKLLNK